MREGEAAGAALTQGRQRYRFANVEFDESDWSLRVDHRPVAVERRPLMLLSCLLRHPDETLGRHELLAMVWEGRPTVEHVLASAVSKLRSALGPLASQHLVTVPRTGYRLDGPVQRLAIDGDAPDPAGWSPGTRLPGEPVLTLVNRLPDPEPALTAWLARPVTGGGLRRVWAATQAAGRDLLRARWHQATRLREALPALTRLDLPCAASLETTPCWLVWEDDPLSLAQARAAEIALPDWPVERRLDLFLHLAEAVAALHEAGWLHNALCPAHVLLAGHRRPADIRLGGLQCASPIGSSPAAAATDAGWAPHRAPECVLGGPGSVQSDVHALGVLLYQLLIAQPGMPLSTGWERAVDDPELRDDIRAATEGDPACRLGSVQALCERLRQREIRGAARRAATEQARLAAQHDRERALARLRRPWIALAAASATVSLGMHFWPAADPTASRDKPVSAGAARQPVAVAQAR